MKSKGQVSIEFLIIIIVVISILIFILNLTNLIYQRNIILEQKVKINSFVINLDNAIYYTNKTKATIYLTGLKDINVYKDGNLLTIDYFENSYFIDIKDYNIYLDCNFNNNFKVYYKNNYIVISNE